MIIRISGEGQYRVDEDVLGELNAVDELVEEAVQAEDEDRFARELSRLLALVRRMGEPLEADDLCPSELILPPGDITLREIAGELATEGLIPE